MVTDCNICRELSGAPVSEFGEDYRKIVASNDNVIFESKSLVVIPSLGPLNSSHVMIVPKSHFNSFAEIGSDIDHELSEVKEKIRAYGRSILGREYLFFESGAGTLTNHAGGCIYHAHLHALSVCSDFDVRVAREIKLTPIEAKKFYKEADVDFGYVLYIDESDNWFFCNNPLLPSQFLRYLYAQCNGVDAYWNWRRHINIEGVKSVVSSFSQFKS